MSVGTASGNKKPTKMVGFSLDRRVKFLIPRAEPVQQLPENDLLR